MESSLPGLGGGEVVVRGRVAGAEVAERDFVVRVWGVQWGVD